MLDRRQFLATAGVVAMSGAAGQLFAQPRKPTRLILLGTKGGPRVINEGSRNCSLVLMINGVPYVVDTGYGVTRQLLAAGIAPESVRYIFITHHHSDHNLEYGPLMYNAWVTGVPIQFDAYGPPGLKKMTQSFFEYMKFDIDLRIADEGRPDLRKRIVAHEFDKPGLVFQNADVKVTSTHVKHPPIQHAYAYRFDAADRSIVISGDTTYSPLLADFAKGADILVHEVMHPDGIEFLLKHVPNAARLREHLMNAHTFPEDVGRIAARAGVKTVVLYHFVPPDAGVTDEQWAAGVRKHFGGRVVVGKDLMEI
jgi:ribonuclease BN (tRNA processing enzyme)